MSDPMDVTDMGDCPMCGTMCVAIEKLRTEREVAVAAQFAAVRAERDENHAAVMHALQGHNARLEALEKAQAQACERAKETHDTLRRISMDVSRMSGQMSMIIDGLRFLRHVGQGWPDHDT